MFRLETAVLTTVIASGSAACGAALKMVYDSVVAHASSNRADAERYIDERKSAYDRFWAKHKHQVRHNDKLMELTLIARAGMEVKPGVLENFTDSSMSPLVDALDEIRRLARTEEIVRVCNRIVALHGDTSAALRYYMNEPSNMYGLPLFLANRLREDQELEFIGAYRKDLGIGPPVGAVKDWPKVKRPFPSLAMERTLRAHLKLGSPGDSGEARSKTLTEKDIMHLNSSRFRALLADEVDQPSPQS